MLRKTLPVAPGGGMATLGGMEPRMKRSRVEMIFIIAMVVLCGGLTVLQYHWTGELARAEMDRMSGSLANQTKLMARAFDAELEHACASLVPTASELNRGALAAVHISKLREWKAGKPRPIFKHIAVAVPTGGKLALFEIGISKETFTSMKWQEEWDGLHENLSDKLAGGPPPSEDDSGFLWEIPVMGSGPPGRRGGPRGPGGPPEDFGGPGFGGDGPGGGPGGPGGPEEREWVILELDADYVRNTWLPELVATHLNPGGNVIYDVTVKPRGANTILFSTLPGGMKGQPNTQTVGFNLQGTGADNQPGPPMKPQWVMEAGPREGSLEATVAESRRKNLAVAVLLNALIIAAGWMLLRATRRSRELAEEQMKFVANVTHELRTPLTVIRGAAHNLKRGIVKDEEGIARYSGLILEHAESLGAMVEQVLDFSSAQRGESAQEHIPVDLKQLLRDSVLTVQGDARFSACHFDLQLPETLPAATGDPASLRRAFQNLIENAAKHGGAGTVFITAKARDGRVEITVRDQGPGIPASELAAIFKPFFRGGRARSDQTRGSGLGLSLVKETAEAHGGKISVSSEPGSGSSFTFSIPT